VRGFPSGAGAAGTGAAIGAAGGQALALSGDCAVEAEAEAMVAACAARFGRVDILVNCAGAAPKQPFGAITAAGFTAMMTQNVLSAVLMMQAVAARFGERGGDCALLRGQGGAGDADAGVCARTGGAEYYD